MDGFSAKSDTFQTACVCWFGQMLFYQRNQSDWLFKSYVIVKTTWLDTENKIIEAY